VIVPGTIVEPFRVSSVTVPSSVVVLALLVSQVSVAICVSCGFGSVKETGGSVTVCPTLAVMVKLDFGDQVN
jgi:hypothetical protein